MKKIFTLMLAFACALFVGVSCTTDSTDPTTGGDNPGGSTEPTYAVAITVDQPAAFEAAGGSQTLNYTLSTEYAGEMLTVSGAPTWLEVTVAEAEPVITVTALSYSIAGSPRTGSFTLSYKDAKDVTVTVSQEAAASVFEVAWSEQTPTSAYATVTNPSDPNMVWGALTFSTSEWSMDHSSPAEYIAWYLDVMKSEMVGYYFGFYQMCQFSPGWALSEVLQMMGMTSFPVMSYNAGPGDKLYLAVVGLNVNADMENYVDNTTLATNVHIFDVETLPTPTLVVAPEITVEAAAGCSPVEVVVENPLEGCTVMVEEYSEWIEASYVDGKLHIMYAENPYALDRKAEVSLVCGVINEYGGLDEYSSAKVVVNQKKNPDVKAVTFKLKVKEAHFNHVVVDVVPSNANAYYKLAGISKTDFNFVSPWGTGYAGDWGKVCAQFGLYQEGVYQGTLKNQVVPIETGNLDPENPEDWKFYIFAFETNEASNAVAGEVSYVETVVKNDTPSIAFELVSVNDETGHYEVVMNDGDYQLKVYKAGEIEIPYSVTNPVAGADLYFNESYELTQKYQFDTDWGGDQYGVLGNDRWVELVDGKIKFTANAYPEGWNKAYDPYMNMSFKYMDAEGNSLNTTIGIKIVLVAPAADPAE